MKIKCQRILNQKSPCSPLSIFRNKPQKTSSTYTDEIFKIIQFATSDQKQQVIEKQIIYKSQLSQNIQIGKWRAMNKDRVVTLNKMIVKVVTQDKFQLRIFRDVYPSRIKDIQLISLPELINMMQSSIQGLNILDKRFGCFRISQQMFAIGQNNKCRVWLNEEYCKNQTQIESDWSKRRHKLINIFKNICLSTVLAQQYFTSLQNSKSLGQMSQLIQRFKINIDLVRKQKIVKNSITKKQNGLNFSSRKKVGLLSYPNVYLSQNITQNSKRQEKKQIKNEIKSKCKLLHKFSPSFSTRSLKIKYKNQSKNFKQLPSLKFSDSLSDLQSNLQSNLSQKKNSIQEKQNITLQTQVINLLISPFQKESSTQILQKSRQFQKLNYFIRVPQKILQSQIEEQDSLNTIEKIQESYQGQYILKLPAHLKKSFIEGQCLLKVPGEFEKSFIEGQCLLEVPGEFEKSFIEGQCLLKAPEENQKQNSWSIFMTCSKGSMKQKIELINQENTKAQCEKIIRNNGWSARLQGLLDDKTDFKNSLVVGAQLQHSTSFRLFQLQKYTKQTTKSIITSNIANPELE